MIYDQRLYLVLLPSLSIRLIQGKLKKKGVGGKKDHDKVKDKDKDKVDLERGMDNLVIATRYRIHYSVE